MDPKLEFVTTMDQFYFDNVGQYLIETFWKYSPKDCRLNVFAENVKSNFLQSDKIKVYDWNHSIYPTWKKFDSKIKKEIKFAKKGLTFTYAMENIDCDYLVWVDADIMFLQHFDKKLIVGCCPKKYLIGLFTHNYLGHKYSSESGFVVLNKLHKNFNSFLQAYKDAYVNKPTELEKWYDGQVCMYAASKFKYNDLSLDRTNDNHTPLNNSPLNQYMYHEKGPNKKRLNSEYFERLAR